MGGEAGGVEAGEGGAGLDDGAHGLGGEGLGDGAALADAPKDRALGGRQAAGGVVGAPGVEPGLQGQGRLADDRLVGIGAGAAGLVGLGHAHEVHEGGLVAGAGLAGRARGRAGVVERGGGDLGAAPAAAGEGEEQQRAVAQAGQGVVAGIEQRLQRLAGERGLGVGLGGAAAGVAAPEARGEFAHAAVDARVLEALELVDLRQHAHAVREGRERGRAQGGLVAGGHECGVDRLGQIVQQAAGVVLALAVVDDELQHHGHRQRQLQASAVAQAEPGGPVAHGGAVAAHRVGRLALIEQIAQRGHRAGAELVGGQHRRAGGGVERDQFV